MSYAIDAYMIKSFVHKGLQNFFEFDSTAGIQAKHEKRLRLILSALDSAVNVQSMNLPTFRLHQLKGKKKGVWSITVNANWRVTFLFEEGNAYVVDYLDYH